MKAKNYESLYQSLLKALKFNDFKFINDALNGLDSTTQEDLIYDLLMKNSLDSDKILRLFKIGASKDILAKLVSNESLSKLEQMGDKLGIIALSVITKDIFELATSPKNNTSESRKDAISHLKICVNLLQNCDAKKLKSIVDTMEQDEQIAFFSKMSLVLVNLKRVDISATEKPNILESYVMNKNQLAFSRNLLKAFAPIIASNTDFFRQLWQTIDYPTNSHAYLTEQKRITAMMALSVTTPNINKNGNASITNDRDLDKTVNFLNNPEKPAIHGSNKMLNTFITWLKSLVKKITKPNTKKHSQKLSIRQSSERFM